MTLRSAFHMGVAWLAVLSVFVFGGAARGQTTGGCTSGTNAELILPACTKLIESGTVAGHDLAVAYNNRGQAYAGIRQFNLAIADYTKAIETDARYAEAYVNRALSRVENGEYDLAIADSNTALRIEPSSGFAYLARAFAYDLSGRYDLAIKDYTTLVDANPNNVLGHVNRAGAYFGLGDYASAIMDYAEALRHDPNNANAYYGRGAVLFAMRRFPDAVRDFSATISIDRSNVYAVLLLYLARNRAGDPQAITSKEFAMNVSALNLSKWPGPVIRFFIGKTTVAALVGSAKTPGEQCEALFYAGEFNKAHNQPSAGQKQLQQADKICPRNSNEYRIARAELLSSLTALGL
jgi:tetratricopeptide (TPR) repeat protein